MIVAQNPLSHVLDTDDWHIFESLHWHFSLRQFGVTKYTVIMLIAAALACAIFIPLARKIRSGEAPRGLFWNAFEGLLTFIRDNVAKPYIGHDADHYVHYLWTVFIFILFCNLLGMVPFMGSPTASITVTLALAAVTFLFIHISAIAKNGLVGYLHGWVPHIDVPYGMGYFILPLIVAIEVLGAFIKAGVLAIRLFANMFAGHLVLATLLMFIQMAANHSLFWPVTIASVLGVVLMSLLELFVAFLQAFIFTFLTALFLGSTLHPEH